MKRALSPLRLLPAQLLGVCALCALAQYVVVRPEHQTLSLLRADTHQLLQRGADATRLPATSPQAIERVRAQATQGLSDLRRQAQGPDDESAMFALISRLASQRHVRLDSVSSDAPPPASSDIRDLSLKLSSVGAYQDLAAFLADIQQSLGISEITSLRLTPLNPDDPALIRADVRVTRLVIANLPNSGAHP